MNIEKVKEIKKALEFCTSLKKSCRDCDYSEIGCYKLLRDIITLINELESENKRLLESCKNCHYIKDLEIANGHAKELKDRIAELEKENGKLNIELDKRDCIDYPCRLIERELLKQFAERLKERMNEGEYMGEKYKLSVFRDIDIDETLKEFIKDRVEVENER